MKFQHHYHLPMSITGFVSQPLLGWHLYQCYSEALKLCEPACSLSHASALTLGCFSFSFCGFSVLCQSRGSILLVVFTAKLCAVATCQHLGISRILRVGEYNVTGCVQRGLSHCTYSVVPFSQRLTLNQVFESNAL